MGDHRIPKDGRFSNVHANSTSGNTFCTPLIPDSQWELLTSSGALSVATYGSLLRGTSGVFTLPNGTEKGQLKLVRFSRSFGSTANIDLVSGNFAGTSNDRLNLTPYTDEADDAEPAFATFMWNGSAWRVIDVLNGTLANQP